MTEMWLSFAVLALVALLFVVVPFFTKEQVVRLDHDANADLVEIFQRRREELADELANERIDKGAFEESLVELKRRLLNELAPERTLTSRGNNTLMALVGGVFLLLGSAVFYAFTGNQAQLSAWDRAMAELPELGQKALAQSGEQMTANELQALVLGLRTRLAQNGDDEVAWMMLGRVAMSLNDFEMAMQAFDKALAMNPDSIGVKLSYAQALLIQGSESAMSRAGVFLSQVLRQQPDNMDAISMLALIAYERKDWPQAKAAFSLIQGSMDKADPRYAMIGERIREIDAKLSDDMPVQQGEAGFMVHVSLSQELQDKLPENGTLFIFARALNGPKMPLAVVRKETFTLPLTVHLSEKDAMMAGLTLANFASVEVVARVSKDADVGASAGELEGRSDAVTVADTEQVSVQINQLLK